MKKTIERVTKMENILDELTMIVERSDQAMNELTDSLKDLNILKKYYESQSQSSESLLKSDNTSLHPFVYEV